MKNVPGVIYSKLKVLLRFLALERGALLGEIESLEDRLHEESERASLVEEQRDRYKKQRDALRRRCGRGRASACRCSMQRGPACGSCTSRRQKVLYRFQLGQILVGGVTEVTEYGVYVEIEEVTWLVRVPACWRGETGRPCEVVAVGRRVQVKLIGTRYCATDPFLVLV